MIELGRWADDPRITRVSDVGVSAGPGWVVQCVGRAVSSRGGVQVEHPTVDDALSYLLGSPATTPIGTAT